MHVAPPAIWTVVVPAGVTILLGLRNPPCSLTDTVGPSLPDYTVALVWVPCHFIGRLGGPSLSFKTVPKSKVCVYIYTIAFELSYTSLG
jgi:hypothetical protein